MALGSPPQRFETATKCHERKSLNASGTVAFATVHTRVRYRGRTTGLYALALADETLFFSRVQPALYDRMACRITMREILPGSRVIVQYQFDETGTKWMTAIQVVYLAEDQSPFTPVSDQVYL